MGKVLAISNEDILKRKLDESYETLIKSQYINKEQQSSNDKSATAKVTSGSSRAVSKGATVTNANATVSDTITPKGTNYRLTEAGKKVVAENPEKIDSKYLEQFPSFVDFASASDPVNGDDSVSTISKPTDLTPDDQLEDAYKQINASLASDLLSEVLKISPYTFEKLVVDLLSKMGYGTVAYGSHATVASGDDGIDGVIMEDKLGFSLIYMQAKEWAPDRVVGQPDIQSFVGAIAGKHGDGLFVTTAKFSQKAKDYANTHHIILIDGERLANLMIEYNFCVSTRKTFEIKAIDTDALAEYQDE